VGGDLPAGPAGVPDDVVRTLHGKFANVLNAPDLNRKLTDQGWVIDPITPDAFRELIKDDIIRVGRLLKETGTTLGARAE